MSEVDKRAFAAALAELAMLKRTELTSTAYAAWWSAMRSEWCIDDFRSACRQLAKECQFFPSPFEFEQLRKAAGQTGADAWTAVLANLRRGAYRNGNTVGGRTDRVIAVMGGYAALGFASSGELHFRERRIAELWAELDEAETARAALSGLAEAETRPSLARESRPVVVGELLKEASGK